MSMTSLSSLSSDDEKIQRDKNTRRNPPKLDAFVHFSDDDFKKRFSFSKQTVRYVAKLIGPQVAPATNRSNAVSAKDQLCITLSFFVSGSYQRLIGDFFRLQQASVNRIVHRVVAAIASLAERFIRMPETTSESETVVNKFFSIAGIPRIVGVLDCFHIKTQSPGGPNAETFRNKKGFFSLNVEVVGDADMLVRNVVASWPGSVHNCTIFHNSPLSLRFENGDFGEYLLLGNGGYPCRSYLLTPVEKPTSPAEEAYNHAHMTSRKTVKCLFSIIKKRFPCLEVGLGIKTERVPAVVVACCVLHNIATMRNDTYEYNNDEDVEEYSDNGVSKIHSDSDPHGKSVREEIIRNFFL